MLSQPPSRLIAMQIRFSLHRSLAACVSCAGIFLSPQLAPAQQRPGETAAAPTTAEPTVELPPFEVRTDKDEGYLAQNTASGSRLNTGLKDTAAPISVFTSEFLADLGATDIAELSDFIGGAERLNGLQGDVAGGNEFAGGTASLRVRGLPSTRMANFFSRGSELDTFNTERIELARGGNALLFGPGSGGGVFNLSTKKADLRRTLLTTTLRAGEFDQFRGAVDANVPLKPGTAALRVNALDEWAGSWRPHEFKASDRLALAGRWQVNRRLLFNAEYEINNVRSSRHRIWGTYDSYTDWNNAGRRLDPKTVPAGLVQPGTSPARAPTLAEYRAALGITATAAGQQFWVYDSTAGQLINYSAATSNSANVQSRSANTLAPVAPAGSTVPGSGQQENPMLRNFSVVPKAVAVYGDGIGNQTDLDVLTASLTYEAAKNLFVEFAYFRQDSVSTTYDSAEFARVQWDTSPTTLAGTPNPNALRPFIEMTPNQRYQRSLGDDARATVSYDLDLGRILGRHRMAAAAERVMQKQSGFTAVRKLVTSAPGSSTPANATTADHASNTIRYRTYVDLQGPVENIAVFNFRQDPTGSFDWVPSSNVNRTKRVTDTALAAVQSYFWNDRLVATLGYRKDYLESWDSTTARSVTSRYRRADGTPLFQQGELYAVRNAAPRKNNGITRSLGAVFHATTRLSLFANRSSTFSQGNVNNRIERDTPAPNTKGVSDDLGVKLSLLDGRLFATATYFETAARNDTASLNVNVTRDGINAIWDSLNTLQPGETRTPLAVAGINIDDVRSSVNAFTFDSASQGWEVEVVANPSRALRLSFGFSDRVTKRTNTGPELFAYMDRYRDLWNRYRSRPTSGAADLGARLDAIDADHAIRLLLPDGQQQLGSSRDTARLRGNYFFREGRLAGFSLGGGARWNGDAVVGYGPRNEPLKAKRYTIVDATAGYRTRVRAFGRRLDLEFQLNVNNLFNEDRIVVTRLFSNHDIRTYEFQLPRQIYLTTTARF
jgi:outer membrane receptor protein involved in Fe transport